MKNKNKTIIYITKLTIVFAIVFFVGHLALANPSPVDGLNEAANQGYNGKTGTSDPGMSTLPETIGKVIGIVLQFVGLAFFILMIYGGFIWMFARGNDQDVQKAKDLIQSAIIGLIIVLAAYAITMFIGNALTSGTQPVGAVP